ncbi:hypothetical protein BHM03_00029540 [Ensete ventricosum]|nr:hypothetical protein BHM03_00029540 [Ensete ventricosum]
MYMAIAEEGSSSMEHKTATISLANFKAKHLELELEDDRFTDYLKVKNVPMLTKVSLGLTLKWQNHADSPKAEARASELLHQLEDAKHHLADLAKQLKEVRGHNHMMVNELLRLTRELEMVEPRGSELSQVLDMVKMHSSKLTKKPH